MIHLIGKALLIAAAPGIGGASMASPAGATFINGQGCAIDGGWTI